MAIKSARSVTPFILIRVCQKRNSDIKLSPKGKVVFKSVGILFLLLLILKAKLVVMKEYVSSESNNIYTS